ncbi:hypothetical protein RhiirA1_480128 [Rhizophagus irregularis]|uniref:Crinkler effector protein N-terminal domain-containing protein n=1 Tax=Rhizophagus irregularis TaxID=588596 RepID=A0A2N0QPS4_9GLOM|nr:hypothetical protein RhiirA1_480128 [Rhizophagus irregularis]
MKVSINKKKSIYKLKKEIKKELSDAFQNIDPIGIKLWSVQLRQNDSRLTQLRNYSASEVDNLGKEAQYSTFEVGEYFNTNVRDNIHVIVQGKENWCAVCDMPFKNGEILKKHGILDETHKTLSGEKSKPAYYLGVDEGINYDS